MSDEREMRRFRFELTFDVQVDIDAAHLAELMSDEWQSFFYQFVNEKEALGYVARLLLIGGSLKRWDGHAHLDEDAAYLQELGRVEVDWLREVTT